MRTIIRGADLEKFPRAAAYRKQHSIGWQAPRRRDHKVRAVECGDDPAPLKKQFVFERDNARNTALAVALFERFSFLIYFNWERQCLSFLLLAVAGLSDRTLPNTSCARDA